MEEQEREAQEFVNRVYSFAANLMFEQEKSATETKRILVEEGLREEDAEVVVTNFQNQLQQAKSEAGNKNMLYGALWCIGGLVVTALTYSAASDGGTYVEHGVPYCLAQYSSSKVCGKRYPSRYC